MDSVNHSAVTPRKSRLARAIAKVLHKRAAATGVSPDDTKKDVSKISIDSPPSDHVVREAFLAKVFASVSSVKAAYAQMQYAQCPYDADGIQAADEIVVSELKKLSELKRCYLKNEVHEPSPETTLLESEIQEQSSVLKTYEISSKKLDSQLKLKESEITFLREKLADTQNENEVILKTLQSSGNVSALDIAQLSSLRLSHFVAFVQHAIKSVRSFVHLMISEMDCAGWDLAAGASSVQPGVSFWRPNHICFAYESFVCREMFEGFDYPHFGQESDSLLGQDARRAMFFERFKELKSVRAADYVAWKPESTFGAFCRAKYLRVIHPKMEISFFGNLNQRESFSSGGELPDSPLFISFIEMAKRVWLLHCLAFSFDPEVSIFQVSKGGRFSEIYMESLSDEAFTECDPRVAFVVVPGFKVGTIIVQSQVYLC
ncbi:hypothetical protein ACS0TY_017051 [Phlomoides rotata]